MGGWSGVFTPGKSRRVQRGHRSGACEGASSTAKGGVHAGVAALRMITVIAMLGAIPAAPGAVAQAYPAKSIRIIVPNATGSGPDIIARLIGQKFTEAWGQQTIIDPRAGAGGMIGAEMAARAAPDGYTLLLVTPTTVNGTMLYPNVKFDMGRDFTPVSLLVSTPYVLVVHPSIPVKTVNDLIALAKAKPGEIYFGSGGSGAMPHLCVEVFNAMSGIKMTHVPYKGFTPALNDLVAGQIQLVCSASAPVTALIAGGKLRGLGVTTLQPTPLAPGLTPVARSVPGFEVNGWYGLFAPAGTPGEIIAKLNAAVANAMKSPEFQERFAGLGVEPVASSPQDMGAVLQNDLKKWGAVIKSIGVRIE